MQVRLRGRCHVRSGFVIGFDEDEVVLCDDAVVVAGAAPEGHVPDLKRALVFKYSLSHSKACYHISLHD